MSKTDFINLQVNGRLFPSWVMQNFKKFYIEQIKRDIGSDPCAVGEGKLTLRKYQEFVGKFMDYQSPYKSIMLYHGLGSGKTITAINVYMSLFKFSNMWNVFVLIKATKTNYT